MVWAGPLALYSSRRITLAAPQYTPPPPPPPVRPSVPAGSPRTGRTSNLEPLLHGLRAGSLPPASLRGLAACLGGQVGEEGELGEAVRRAVEGWREREGAKATLATFLLMLQRPEVVWPNPSVRLHVLMSFLWHVRKAVFSCELSLEVCLCQIQ